MSAGQERQQHPGPPDIPGQEKCERCDGFLGDDAYGKSRMCRCGRERQQQIEAGQKALESLTKHIPATRETQAEYRAVVKALNAAARLSELQDTLAAKDEALREIGTLAAGWTTDHDAGYRLARIVRLQRAALALNIDGEATER